MSVTIDETSPRARRTVRVPSAQVLLATVYSLCVLYLMAAFVVEILVSDKDPYRSEGPVSSLIGVGVLSSIALAIAVGGGTLLVRTPERARIGAVVFGALAVLTVIVFWSGTPALFGATAAWLAGITRGGRPLGGAARVAGVVGLFIAALNVVTNVGGPLLTLVS